MVMDDLKSLGFADRGTFHVSQYEGTIFTQDTQDTVEEMSGTGTDGLGMMLALVDHLVIVNGSYLWVMQAGHIRIQVGVFLDKAGSSLGNLQTLCFSVGRLLAVGHHA